MEYKARLDREFEEFIKEKLDPEGNHLDEDKKLIVDFDYFQKMVQACWWWSRYRYEKAAEAMQTMRRELLRQENMKMYK